MMEQGVNEVQGLLTGLKKNIAELQSSFEETVEKQAAKLASSERRKLRKKFRTEQEEFLHEYKREKSETEGLLNDIKTHLLQCLSEVKREKDENLKAVTQEERLKNSKELEKVITETKNDTIAELSSCSEAEVMQLFGNVDLVSTDTPRCATCGKESELLYFCAACEATRYCDENCQALNWEKHKSTCVGLN